MKNFLILCVNLAVGAFTLVAIGTFLNALFGLHLGYGGTELPNEAAFGVIFLAIAAVCGAAAFFLNKKQ